MVRYFKTSFGLGLLALVLVVTSCVTTERLPQVYQKPDLVVATYNVHFSAPWQRKRSWENRKYAVSTIVESLKADIILFQEMESFVDMNYRDDNLQLTWILSRMPIYSVASIDHSILLDPDDTNANRDEDYQSDTFPSSQPILFRNDRFRLLDEGFLTFSESPDTPYAPPWYGGGYPSQLTWAKFEDLFTRDSLVVVNIHFDAFNRRNRMRGAALAAERLPEIIEGADRQIVGGDFNAHNTSPTLDLVRSIGLSESGIRGSTYHFYRGIHITPGIDHILVAQGLETIATRRYLGRVDGIRPSDHYPVVVELSYTD